MGELNEEQKRVYPLFQKNAKPRDTKPKTVEPPIPATSVLKDESDLQPSSGDVPKKPLGRPRKKPKNVLPVETLNAAANTSAVPQEKENGQAELLEVDPNNSRRKRRKTDSPVHGGLLETGDKDGKDMNFSKKEMKGRISKKEETSPSTRKAERLSQPLISLQESKLGNGLSPSTNIPHVLGPILPPSQIKNGSGVLETHIGNDPAGVNSAASQNGLQHKNGIQIDETNPASTSEKGVFDFDIKSLPSEAADNKPKKILRLNTKTGTIGSPPAKKIIPPVEPAAKVSSRRKFPRSNIITILYGDGELLPLTIGPKIEQILNGAFIVPVPSKTVSGPPKAKKPAPNQPPKALHPLFMGKAASKPPDHKSETANKASNVVDGKEPMLLGRARARTFENPNSPHKPKVAPFAGFGTSSMILRFPGAVEPAWPWHGMVHVRPDASQNFPWDASNRSDDLQIRSKAKKSKYQAIQILPKEDVIGALATELGIGNVVESIRETNPDEFPPLPACLRIPIKHYEGGSAIQRRVRNETRSQLPLPNAAGTNSSDDEIQTNTPIRATPHPAITKAYDLIPTTMSAFDQGHCETQSWTRKYSPKCAADVLQSGREAFVLKEWLERLNVQSVETGLGDQTAGRASSLSRTGPNSENVAKRKRKLKKLDGFVISSDEEDNEMDEITDPEDNVLAETAPGLLKKTVIRSGDANKGIKDSGRVTNAVVISGPHGSGKTAAVYAVAKELGFEVFEINSSSRRSGKDILEKVGDMTRNHLVQRSQAPVSVDEDEKRMNDALAQDLQSGRQGTMNSFFKPKENPKTKPSRPKTGFKKEIKDQPLPKAPIKQQKQSLILIEEADILYEEDKNFWATILDLTIKSKRPMIITCSDESLLPMNALMLYAIIRFVPPSIDLATDYMLLVAGCEGHVLRRDAVKTLYEGRSLDLRASLTDLNFWCQFAVGDLKCGLDWFYPRWSRGSDVDEYGETIRVVSENTYEAGMGWVSQDVLESHVHYLDIEEEMLHEACDGWQLDVGDWQENIGINSWASKIQTVSRGKKDDISALRMYEDFATGMSDAELFSGLTFAPENKILLDVNMPELSTKVREDYILAHQVIEASPLVAFTTTSKDISLWMKSRARKYLQVDQHIQHGYEVPAQLDGPGEGDVLRLIKKQAVIPDPSISRSDFSLAFDPISEVEKYLSNPSNTLEASSFDRHLAIISVDLAPYIRSIVAYDARLQEERTRMSNLLSEGGRKGKRMRTTRAAMSALEGGARSTTRRDRYFGSKLNSQFVLKTGMQSWLDAAMVEERIEREALKLIAERDALKAREMEQEGGRERDDEST
ncbi:ATPase family AAA domain-containing protein [Lachnellula occidentalis]|uniref:ATPase family AAA domain-containing protein n=1 Tax=Lachnellula occidentalis TaxID=215460 RepID=A0A8H8S7W0_9HELO|nr:ATPase family AAA domain-containing protein [Lachnellula occidentalis]